MQARDEVIPAYLSLRPAPSAGTRDRPADPEGAFRITRARPIVPLFLAIVFAQAPVSAIAWRMRGEIERLAIYSQARLGMRAA
jgi:hypothetical protein